MSDLIKTVFKFPDEITEDIRKERLLLEMVLLSTATAFIYSGIMLMLGYYEIVYIAGSYGVFSVFNVIFYQQTKRYNFFKSSQLFLLAILPIINQIYAGGFTDSGGNIIATLLAAIGALLFDSIKLGRIFFGVFVIGLIAVTAYELNIPDEGYNVSRQVSVILFSITIICVLSTIYFVFEKFIQKIDQAQKELTTEKEKADALLLNILPPSISEELKNAGEAKARGYASASVIFADIVGFSKTSKYLTPGELVLQLDTYFRAFDDIMEKYGIEKIKTLGDAYLAVSGVPEESFTHAESAIKAALEMQKAVKKIYNEGKVRQPFELRIGVHSGPLIAGVVGKKKFTYDIWGDTVNIASRMEHHGVPGQINISESTFNLVQHKFKCTARGKISAKNVGELEMYFVEK